jgi:hypothetical protein
MKNKLKRIKNNPNASGFRPVSTITWLEVHEKLFANWPPLYKGKIRI